MGQLGPIEELPSTPNCASISYDSYALNGNNFTYILVAFSHVTIVGQV